jgi:hypothetical protein
MADDEGGMSDEDFHDAVQEHKISMLQEHKINVLQYINTEIMYISFCSSCRVEPALQQDTATAGPTYTFQVGTVRQSRTEQAC